MTLTNVELGWLDEIIARHGAPRTPLPIRNGRTLSRSWLWGDKAVHLRTDGATPDTTEAYALSVCNGTSELHIRREGVPAQKQIRDAVAMAGLLGCARCDDFLEEPAGRDGGMEKWQRCPGCGTQARRSPVLGWAEAC